MRNAESQALDKQLSNQAYYAAEAGINSATKAIDAGFIKEKNTCGVLTADPTNNPGSQFLADNTVGGSSDTTGASYPCLLIDPMPKTLEYDPIGVGQSRVVYMETHNDGGDAVMIHTIKVSWEDAAGGTTFAGSGSSCETLYPSSGGATNWNATSMLRVEIIPIAAGSGYLQRDNLMRNMAVAFLCPNAGNGHPGSVTYTNASGPNAGVIVKGNCNTAAPLRHCSATITGLQVFQQSSAFLTLRSMQSSTRVTVEAFSSDSADPTSGRLRIAKAQTLVDSTGKAQDVLRRIQARVPAYDTYDIPDGTVGTICKQLYILPNSGSSSSACQFPGDL
jgi:hypothetical protein